MATETAGTLYERLKAELAGETPDEAGMRDAHGRFVPLRLISAVDLLRHELVVELCAKAEAASRELAAFKANATRELEAFIALSAEKYHAQIGGQRGNVTLLSFDGKLRITRQIADTIAFDERLQAARALIDECIEEWTQGSRAEVRALIEHAFQADRLGQVSVDRVLSLRRLDIDSPKWQEAMKAIGESIHVASRKPYLRFHRRNAAGDWEPISLDLASLREVSP